MTFFKILFIILLMVGGTVGLMFFFNWFINQCRKDRPYIIDISHEDEVLQKLRSKSAYVIELRYLFGLLKSGKYLTSAGVEAKTKSIKELYRCGAIFTDPLEIEKTIKLFMPPKISGKAKTLNEIKTEKLIDG